MKKEDLIARLDWAGINYSDRVKEIFADWGPYSLHAIVSEANECSISMSYFVWQGPVCRIKYFNSIEDVKADLVRSIKLHYPAMGEESEADLLECMRL